MYFYTKGVVVFDKVAWYFPGEVLFSAETKSIMSKIDFFLSKASRWSCLNETFSAFEKSRILKGHAGAKVAFTIPTTAVFSP